VPSLEDLPFPYKLTLPHLSLSLQEPFLTSAAPPSPAMSRSILEVLHWPVCVLSPLGTEGF
jgi:hypothetical protein